MSKPKPSPSRPPSPRRPKRSSKKPRARKRGAQKRFQWLRATLIGLSLTLLLVISAGALIWSWAGRPGRGQGQLIAVTIEPGSELEVGEQLQAAGLLDRPWLFRVYLRLFKPKLTLEPGEHLLLDSLAPRDLAVLLGRLRNRPNARVTLREGWNHHQIGAELEARGICSKEAFIEAVSDASVLGRVGLSARSAEGYLFPETYEFLLNSNPEAVVVVLVRQAKAELARLTKDHREDSEQLEEELGFSEHDWVTFASILEREATNREELPMIASVFLNRLSDPDFRPQRMLQSDPTAAYGCLVEPERAKTCQNFQGKVEPAMLRDADNRYNTYRHAGLPPGPISNPGRAALTAALKPAESDFLFFFADGKGNHTFTRTFEEHRAAIRRRQLR